MHLVKSFSQNTSLSLGSCSTLKEGKSSWFFWQEYRTSPHHEIHYYIFVWRNALFTKVIQIVSKPSGPSKLDFFLAEKKNNLFLLWNYKNANLTKSTLFFKLLWKQGKSISFAYHTFGLFSKILQMAILLQIAAHFIRF